MRHFCTRIAICSAIVLLCGAPLASAQSDEVTLVPDSEGIDEIIVTGSRIRRDTYSSIAPLQIITAKSAREAGLQDATAILQESIAATGNQTDDRWRQGNCRQSGLFHRHEMMPAERQCEDQRREREEYTHGLDQQITAEADRLHVEYGRHHE